MYHNYIPDALSGNLGCVKSTRPKVHACRMTWLCRRSDEICLVHLAVNPSWGSISLNYVEKGEGEIHMEYQVVSSNFLTFLLLDDSSARIHLRDANPAPIQLLEMKCPAILSV